MRIQNFVKLRDFWAPVPPPPEQWRIQELSVEGQSKVKKLTCRKKFENWGGGGGLATPKYLGQNFHWVSTIQ